MTDAPQTTPGGLEAEALWLRSQHLGTDYPEVAWQDAPSSERAAWTRLAALRTAFPTAVEADDRLMTRLADD